jgi:pilus assembly protein CpaC
MKRVTAVCVAVACLAAPPPALAATGTEPAEAFSPSEIFSTAAPGEPLELTVGEIRPIPVSGLTRVAIADPAVLDVSVVSSKEVLLQAKKAGATNFIIWDQAGQRAARVEVTDAKTARAEAELKRVLATLGFDRVQVTREQDKLFVTGEVPTSEDLDKLRQVLGSFEGVTNLVVFPPAPPEIEPLAPLVKLGVQVIEISHSDLEKLGIDWSEGFTVREPGDTFPTTADTAREALLKWGDPVNRTTLAAAINALVEKEKARILSEPKLVTASGKEAESFVGVEVPILSAAEFGAGTATVTASIDFRQTGVRLKMTPTVHEDAQGQRITTTMEAEVSDIDKSVGLSVPVGSQTILVPGFTSRKARTEVTSRSGETIVIAGLLTYEDSNSLTQVPGLGSIPVFGRLFRSPVEEQDQREVVIAVTPELVSDETQLADRGLALERALAVAEVTASVEDPRLRYALTVQDRIAKALRYPQREKELNLDGTVKLKLHLFADGTLGRTSVSSSSGLEALDAEALKAAESQAPYPPFPSTLSERELWLEIPVIFRP